MSRSVLFLRAVPDAVSKRTMRGVTALLEASIDDVEKLARTLEAVPPKLSLRDYANAVVEQSELPLNWVLLVLPVLGELQQVIVAGGTTPEKLASDLVDATEALPDATQPHEKLRPLLIRLLHASNVFIANKAGILSSARRSVYRGVDIISDLTPVFGASIGDGPAGFIIRHVLRLTSSNTDSRAIETIEIALDLEDITAIQATLTRAAEKHEQLLQVLKAKDLACLN